MSLYGMKRTTVTAIISKWHTSLWHGLGLNLSNVNGFQRPNKLNSLQKKQEKEKKTLKEMSTCTLYSYVL